MLDALPPLGFRIDSSQALAAAQNLNAMNAAAGRASTGTDSVAAAAQRLIQQVQQQQQVINSATQNWNNYAAAVVSSNDATAKLIDQATKQIQVMQQGAQAVGVMTGVINQQTDAAKKLADANRDVATSLAARVIEENTAKIQALGSAFRDAARQFSVGAAELKDYNTLTAGLGLSATASVSALTTLTKTLKDSSDATATQRSVLAAYGVSLIDTAGNAKTAGEVLADLVKQMQLYADSAQKNAALSAFGINSVDDLRALADATKNQLTYTKDLANAEDQRFANYHNNARRLIRDNLDIIASNQKAADEQSARASRVNTIASTGGLVAGAFGSVAGGATAMAANFLAPSWMDEHINKPLDDALNNVKKAYGDFSRDLAYLGVDTEVEISKQIAASGGGLINRLKINLSEWVSATVDAVQDADYQVTKLLLGRQFADANQGAFFGTKYVPKNNPTTASAPVPLSAYELSQYSAYNLSSSAASNYYAPNVQAAIGAARIPNAIAAGVKSGQIAPDNVAGATSALQLSEASSSNLSFLQQNEALKERLTLERQILDLAGLKQDEIAGERAYLEAVKATAQEEGKLNYIKEQGSEAAKVQATEALRAMEAYRAAARQTAAEAVQNQQTTAAINSIASGTIQYGALVEQSAYAGLSPAERARRIAASNARASGEINYGSATPEARQSAIEVETARSLLGLQNSQRAAASDQMASLRIQYAGSQSLIGASAQGPLQEEYAKAFSQAQISSYSNPSIDPARLAAANVGIAMNNRTAAANSGLLQSTGGLQEVNALTAAYSDNKRSLAALNAEVATYKSYLAGAVNENDQARVSLTKLTEANAAAAQAQAQRLAQLKDQNDILAQTASLSGGAAAAAQQHAQQQQASDKLLLDLAVQKQQAQDLYASAIEKGDDAAAKLAQQTVAAADEAIAKQKEVNDGVQKQIDLNLQLQQQTRDTAALDASNDSLTVAQKQLELLGKTVEERQKELTILRETLAAKRESGGTISQDRLNAITNNARAAEITAQAQKAEQMLDQMVQQFGQGTAQSIVQAFQEGTSKGQSIWTTFATSLQRVLYNAIASVLSAQVFQPLFRSALSSVSGLFTSATGGGILGGSSSGGGSSVGGLGGIGDAFGAVKGAFSGDGFLSASSIDKFGNSLGIGTAANPGVLTNAAGDLVAGPGVLGSVPGNASGATAASGGLSSYLPYAGAAIGGISGILQIMNAKSAGGVIGGVGSIASGLMLLNPATAPFAPLVALGGNLLGGLFGGKKSVGPGGGIGFGVGADGKANVGFTSQDNGYDPVAANIDAANSIGAAAVKFFSQVGGTFKGTAVAGRGGELGYDAGLKKYTGGDDTSNGRGRFDTLEQAMSASLVTVIKNSVVEGVSKDIQDRIRAINTSQDMEGLLQYIAQLNQVYDSFKSWAPPITAAEAAMNQLNAQFDQAKKAAESLSKSTDDLQKSYDKQRQYLIDQFNQPLQSRYLRVTGKGLDADLADFDVGAAQTRQAAAALGNAAIAQAEKTLTAERLAIQLKYQEQAKQAEQARLSSLYQSYESLVVELKNLRDVWKGIAEQMLKFRDSLKVGALSTLSPEQQMLEAQRQYSETLKKARGGDVRAAGELQGYAQQALQQTQSYYASGQGYADYFNQVQNDLTSFADYATQQVSIADQQLGVQKSIDASARTIAQIMQDMENAKKAINAAGGSVAGQPAGPTGLDGGGFGDASKSVEQNIRDAYQSYWGRSAADWEVKAWTDTIAQTGSASQAIASIQFAPQSTAMQAQLAMTTPPRTLTDQTITSLNDLPSDITSLFKGYASGGDHWGGYRIVDENGPELEATGPARIFNYDQTRQILSNDNSELSGLVRKLIGRIDQLAMISAESGDGAHDRLDGLREDISSLTRTIKNSQLVS